MHPSTIVDQLRASGLYPTLSGGGIRLYGDMAQLTPDFREAISTNRASIIDYLHAPAQSIAYDLLDLTSRDGWHPVVCGQSVTWHRRARQSANPMLTASLRDATDHHTVDLIRVLRNVPAGCRNRARCERQGVCADEIAESACCIAQWTRCTGRMLSQREHRGERMREQRSERWRAGMSESLCIQLLHNPRFLSFPTLLRAQGGMFATRADLHSRPEGSTFHVCVRTSSRWVPSWCRIRPSA